MMLFFKKIVKGWDTFFFEERPTYHLAIFRIIWGTFVFVNLLFDIGNVADFYGPEAILSLEVVQSRLSHFHLSLFHILPNTLTTAWGVYLATLISLVMMTMGLFTRFFLISSFIGIVSLHMRNVWILSSADILIRCIFLILIWSPCYQVLSLDYLRAKRKGRELPINKPQWTWRLIQLQVCVLYLWTAWVKVKGGDWIEGSAVYYATRLETMRNMTIPWLLDNIVMLKFTTWMTLLIELSLATLIWVRKFRNPVIVLGILLHLGIEMTLAIPFFEWLMIILLMTFFSPEEYGQFYEKLKLKYLHFKLK